MDANEMDSGKKSYSSHFDAGVCNYNQSSVRCVRVFFFFLHSRPIKSDFQTKQNQTKNE